MTASVNQAAPGTIRLTDEEYRLIRDLVYSRFGINLTEQKRALIVGRLQKILREKGFLSFRQYYDHVVSDKSGEALTMLVNRISTNHTFFYRENDHFDFLLNEVLPEIRARIGSGPKKLRIWCAGCSTGEEPYTLAIIVKEFLQNEIGRWDIGILATDISQRVLDLAEAGVYPKENLDKLPAKFKKGNFHARDKENWVVADHVKKLVLFRRFNLMRTQFPFKGKFDVIFCRNVMIYFDDPTKSALIKRFHQFTAQHGYLFIGHSETLGRNNTLFRYVKPAVYKKEA